MGAIDEAFLELEQRVTRRFLERFDPQWKSHLGSWKIPEPLPDDVPQFPRQQWVTYPAKRAIVLMICDRMMDFDELTDAQWHTVCFLMQYGGKEQVV